FWTQSSESIHLTQEQQQLLPADSNCTLRMNIKAIVTVFAAIIAMTLGDKPPPGPNDDAVVGRIGK
ncbi:hypothetical protein Ocin01_13609, partial [Orchesella cincta]